MVDPANEDDVTPVAGLPLDFERSVHREVVLIKVRRYRRLKMRFRPRGVRRYW